MRISLTPNAAFIEFIGFVKSLDRMLEKFIKNAFLLNLIERTLAHIFRVVTAYSRKKSIKQ